MDARGEERRTRRVARGWVATVLLVASMTTAGGCKGAGETTDKMIPRGWKGNAWGPVANAARVRGEIATVPNNPDMDHWDGWAKQNLRDGDILFRMGDARAACGLFPFSRVSAAIADSQYSHTGVVAFEGGEPVVYDTSTAGPQRQPFPIWVLDTRGSFAVKRPAPQYADAAPRAVAFCREVYQSQVPFDYDMKLGDDRLYCIELTQRSYESAGLPLSQPLRLDNLPRYRDFPWVVRILKLATPMVPDQRAYVIGNERIGIWSSPALDLVYQAPHALPPTDGPGAVAAFPETSIARFEPPPDVVRR